MRNHTVITTFTILGFTDYPQLQILIFICLFIAYLLSITGNMTIILLVLVDPHLKTAMYYFLKKLEISYTCIPRFLYNLATGDRIITYNSCLTQLFFIYVFAKTQVFLLTIMSYDCYVAICKPLHYVTIMSLSFCKRLVFCCRITALLLMIPGFILSLGLDFCDSNVVDHFGCDANPLLKILSYVYIIRTILRFPSAQQGKRHFPPVLPTIAISISYGSCIFVYLKPSAKDHMTMNKWIMLLTTSISPMLNPFMYTLRNRQVKQAFNHLIAKLCSSQGIRGILK